MKELTRLMANIVAAMAPNNTTPDVAKNFFTIPRSVTRELKLKKNPLTAWFLSGVDISS